MTQLDVRSAPQQTGRDTQSAPPPEASEAVRWWALVVVVVLVAGAAVWATSPRFAIDTPSLVDDWAAIDRSPEQLSDIVRFAYPEEQRFRPGWILWNYLQWHTFDAPQDIVGPNVWNILRILVLVVGLTLLMALALPPPRGRAEAVLQAALAGVPALLVVTAPKFAVDMARFGPQEPLLLGGMALGGSLLLLASRSLLDVARPLAPWRTTMLGLAGSALWVLGVYQKESSLAALPLIAAVIFVGRARLAHWNRLTSARRVVLGGLAAVVVLPFVHVVVESARIVSRGDLVYDAEVDRGLGVAKGLELLYDWAHEALPPNWRYSAIGAVVLTVLAAVVRRRVDAIALGALASGVLVLALAGQSGVVSTRYYIPAFALFMVALAVSLARFPPALQVLALVAILFVFVPPEGTREEVSRWVDEERQGEALVRTVANLEGAGCLVAVGGLGEEESQALPVLVRVETPRSPQACDNATYLVAGPGDDGSALTRACAPGALEPLLEVAAASVYRCTQLRTGAVRDPDLGLIAPEELVAIRRLRV